MSLYTLLTGPRYQPNDVVIQTVKERITQQGFRVGIAKARAWIASQGIEAEDVIAIQMTRSPLFIQLLLACFAEGVIALPLNPHYTRVELRYFVNDSAARLLIADQDILDGREDLKTVKPAEAMSEIAHSEPLTAAALHNDEAPAILMYTSGTTGNPKGAVLKHANIKATVEALYQAWAWDKTDILIHALPLFHVHGLFVAQFVALRAGATSVWLEKFTPLETFQAIKKHQATIFMGIPTFYVRMLALPTHQTFDVSSVRLFTSGSAPLAGKTHRAFEERFGHRILERYGMTEIGIVISNPLDGDRRPGSVGLPLPKVQARIADLSSGELIGDGQVGEVQIRGPSVFGGYLNRQAASAETLVDGWMKTGDIGYRDQDGYYYLVGRKHDTIITGGMNVYPAEVAAALYEHEQVLEAAVFGVHDADLGQRVVALIVSRAEPLALHPWLRQRLAGYKCPKEYGFVSSLARNPMGKVDRQVLGSTWEAQRSLKK